MFVEIKYPNVMNIKISTMSITNKDKKNENDHFQ